MKADNIIDEISFKRTPVETKEKLSIDQIWEQFYETRDEHFRNLLMEHYRSIVKNSAKWMHRKLPVSVEQDDLISAGILGLMDAIEKFDLSMCVKFETYCSPRIRGSILDELRRMDWLPRLVRARAHQLSKATQAFEAHFGRRPTEKELAQKLDMNMDDFNRLQWGAKATNLVSLSTEYCEGKKDILEIHITKDEKNNNPVIEAQKRDLKRLLTKGLTRAEQLIIVLYYYEEMTMMEIGTTLDLSESRISQMHSSILKRLKAKMNTRKNELAFG